MLYYKTNSEKVQGISNHLLSFDTTRTAQETGDPSILTRLHVRAFVTEPLRRTNRETAYRRARETHSVGLTCHHMRTKFRKYWLKLSKGGLGRS